ncbi:MAG: hypothetical protein M1435_02425 [Actinobacteria bacterium]|nr:hypothetical protein [Actinomycetota bacterium]
MTTRVIGRDTLWVHSRLVLDAKTPEQLQREMRAALERMERVQAGQAVDPPRWRRCWNEIVGGEQALGGT